MHKKVGVVFILLFYFFPLLLLAQKNENISRSRVQVNTIRTFTGHTEKVRSVAYSPYGNYIISGSYDYTIKLWDTTGECIRTFSGHTGEIQTVAFSQDGKFAISGSLDSTVKLWNIMTGECLRTFKGHNDNILSVAFSKNDKFIASGSRDHNIRIWETKTGKCLQTLIGHTSHVFSLVFCPNGKQLLSGSGDGTLKLWDIETGRCIQTFIANTFDIYSCSISPSGTFAVSCGIEIVKKWEIGTGLCIGTFKGNNSGLAIQISPNGQYAITNDHNSLVVWNLNTNSFTHTFLKDATITSLAYSPDGNHVIIGTEQNTLQLLEIVIDTSTNPVKTNQKKERPIPIVDRKSNTTIAKVTNNIDVDNNIPVNRIIGNENTFVLIIGNENYNSEPKVKFASNDANTLKKYCEKTLGIPTINIKYCENASYGVFMGGLTWIKNFIKITNGNANIIFYYAGHGMPDEKSKQPYLLPVDGNPEDPATAINLNLILSKLTEYPSKKVLVLLDACFSGGSRDDTSLLVANSRGVKIKPKEVATPSNVILMSASSGDETAFPYIEKGHGLFTYFLLKKLQDTKGDCTLSEMYNYLKHEVGEKALYVNNGKMQTPSLIVGDYFTNTWQNIKLK